MNKTAMIIHIFFAALFTAAAVFMDIDGELLTGSVMFTDINLICTLTLYFGFGFAVRNGLEKPEKLNRIFNAVSAEALLLSLPMVLSMFGMLETLFFMIYVNITVIVLLVTIIYVNDKYDTR